MPRLQLQCLIVYLIATLAVPNHVSTEYFQVLIQFGIPHQHPLVAILRADLSNWQDFSHYLHYTPPGHQFTPSGSGTGSMKWATGNSRVLRFCTTGGGGR